MKKNIDWSYLAGLFDAGKIVVGVSSGKEGDTATVEGHCDTLSEAKRFVKLFGGYFFTTDGVVTEEDEFPKYLWEISGRKNKERFLSGLLAHSKQSKEDLKPLQECLDVLRGTETFVGFMEKLMAHEESVETNTLDLELAKKIESGLIQ
jgi:hypothetical protein